MFWSTLAFLYRFPKRSKTMRTAETRYCVCVGARIWTGTNSTLFTVPVSKPSLSPVHTENEVKPFSKVYGVFIIISINRFSVELQELYSMRLKFWSYWSWSYASQAWHQQCTPSKKQNVTYFDVAVALLSVPFCYELTICILEQIRRGRHCYSKRTKCPYYPTSPRQLIGSKRCLIKTKMRMSIEHQIDPRAKLEREKIFRKRKCHYLSL